jgi:hypothetical protein
MNLENRILYNTEPTLLLVKYLPQRESSDKKGKTLSKKRKVRRGSLSHQKAIVCKGKMGPHAWDSKKKKYEKEAS